MTDMDYVVVGAGSAGCAVACRLVEGGANVALLEAGPKDRDIRIHVPAALRPLLYRDKVNWNFHTEPVESTGGRRVACRAAKCWADPLRSTACFMCAATQPISTDGHRWGAMAGPIRMSCRISKSPNPTSRAAILEYRGGDGPLSVEDYRTVLPLTHRFVEAAQQAGFPFTPDYNGAQQEGVGYSQMTRRGRFRGSTAQTYLRAVRGNPNLRIVTDAQAGTLMFDGRKCVGVIYRQGGQMKEIRAAKEVILCGGAYNSPHLLQISGIGPAAHLKEIGLKVRHDLPGVGGNLADHWGARMKHRVRENEITMNQLSRFPRVIPEVAKYVLFGNGALTFGVTSAIVFCRSRDGLSSPDLQLSFTPATPIDTGQGRLRKNRACSSPPSRSGPRAAAM